MKSHFLPLLAGVMLASPALAQDKEEPQYQGKSLAQWVEIFKSSEKIVKQEEAARALGEMGADAKSAMPILVQALEGSSRRLRPALAEALGKIGPEAKAALPALKVLLEETTSLKTRKKITQSLLAIRGDDGKWTVQRLLHFGLQVKEPSDELIAQLELPEGQGIVIEKVEAGSTAEKAGLQPHDVLLDLGESKVPDTLPGLLKLLESFEIGKPLEAVVLRKGTFETLKGITLPKWIAPAIEEGEPAKTLYLIEVNGDTFTGRYQSGEDRITVKGDMENGRPVATAIHIFMGELREKYENLNDMPQKYRRYARKLMPQGGYRR